eukprot:sb/3466040/
MLNIKEKYGHGPRVSQNLQIETYRPGIFTRNTEQRRRTDPRYVIEVVTTVTDHDRYDQCEVHQYCCYNYTVPQSPWCCDGTYQVIYKDWYLWVILSLITVLLGALVLYFRFYHKRQLTRSIVEATMELEAHYRPLQYQVRFVEREKSTDDVPPPCYSDIFHQILQLALISRLPTPRFTFAETQINLFKVVLKSLKLIRPNPNSEVDMSVQCRVLLKNYEELKNQTLAENKPDFQYQCEVHQYCCYNYTVPQSPWCCDGTYQVIYKDWYLWVILSLITVLLGALVLYFRFYHKRQLTRSIVEATMELEAHYRPLQYQVRFVEREKSTDDVPPPCYSDIVPPSYSAGSSTSETRPNRATDT